VPLAPPLPYNWLKLSTVAEMPTALEAGIQKVSAKIWILGRIRTLGSQNDLRRKIKFLACLFIINYI
jgi:hypothetical protein